MKSENSPPPVFTVSPVLDLTGSDYVYLMIGESVRHEKKNNDSTEADKAKARNVFESRIIFSSSSAAVI